MPRQADVMSHREQLDWLRAEDPVALKTKLLKAVNEYPTSEDIWFLIMDILNMEGV
jgi:hypothetical protein